MRNFSIIGLAGAAVIALTACQTPQDAADIALETAEPVLSAEGDETLLVVADAPAAALEAAKTALEGVEFTEVSLETAKDGAQTYEFGGVNADGRHVEVDTSPEGEVYEVEVELVLEELPESVQDALASKGDVFTATYIEKSVRADGSVVYEFDGVNAKGDATDLEIYPDGEILVIESDLQG